VQRAEGREIQGMEREGVAAEKDKEAESGTGEQELG
jgi:hypothetical protein